jgi:transcriptional regulator with XRE-family HTH domain
MVVIAERLRELLDESPYPSERALARDSGVSIGTIRKILAADDDPSLGVMLHLAYAFGLGSIEELISPLGTTELSGLQFSS